jgi:hypothetical protein
VRLSGLLLLVLGRRRLLGDGKFRDRFCYPAEMPAGELSARDTSVIKHRRSVEIIQRAAYLGASPPTQFRNPSRIQPNNKKYSAEVAENPTGCAPPRAVTQLPPVGQASKRSRFPGTRAE